MKKILLILLGAIAISLLCFWGYSISKEKMLGAPALVYQRTIYPEKDSTYELGTSTLAWQSVTADGFCLSSGSCATSTFGTPSQWLTSGSDISYSTGNVGIGNTSPVYKLDVSGAINATHSSFPVLGFTRETTITGGAFTGTAGIASAMSLTTKSSSNITDGFGGGIVMYAADNGFTPSQAQALARIYARRDGGDATGALQFFAGTNADYPKLTIRATGYVGINTTSPTSYLTVEGDSDITGDSYVRGSILADTLTSYNTATDLTLKAKTTGYNVQISPTDGKVLIGTTTPYDLLTVGGNSYLGGDVRTTNSELYFNSSTGQFSIGSGLLGNINFADDAGLIGGFDTMINSAVAGSPFGFRGFGFSGVSIWGVYAESNGASSTDPSKTRFGIFPDESYGGTNFMGGLNYSCTSTQIVGSATTTLYTYGLASTSTMMFDSMIVGVDSGTGTSSIYHLAYNAKRFGTATAQLGTTVSIDTYEDDATWDAFTSTTATGIAINVVGGATTNTWKMCTKMMKMEP